MGVKDEFSCPPDRDACMAENDPSGTDCIFLKECFPHLETLVDEGMQK